MQPRCCLVDVETQVEIAKRSVNGYKWQLSACSAGRLCDNSTKQGRHPTHAYILETVALALFKTLSYYLLSACLPMPPFQQRSVSRSWPVSVAAWRLLPSCTFLALAHTRLVQLPSSTLDNIFQLPAPTFTFSATACYSCAPLQLPHTVRPLQRRSSLAASLWLWLGYDYAVY